MAKKQKFVFNDLTVRADAETKILFAQFESSNLQALAYLVEEQQLVALFRNNSDRRYHYNNVPPKTFFKVVSSESVGSSFQKQIVKGGFDYYDEPNK